VINEVGPQANFDLITRLQFQGFRSRKERMTIYVRSAGSRRITEAGPLSGLGVIPHAHTMSCDTAVDKPEHFPVYIIVVKLLVVQYRPELGRDDHIIHLQPSCAKPVRRLQARFGEIEPIFRVPGIDERTVKRRAAA
jgi:hypothetical protein